MDMGRRITVLSTPSRGSIGAATSRRIKADTKILSRLATTTSKMIIKLGIRLNTKISSSGRASSQATKAKSGISTALGTTPVTRQMLEVTTRQTILAR